MKNIACLASMLVTLDFACRSPAFAIDQPSFVGSATCAACHQAQYDAWRGSHHDLAMTEATEHTVRGDFGNVEFTAHGVTSKFYRKGERFFVRTDGPDGKLHDYPIRYTFGWYPLQQYLIEFPRGHVQSLGIAWDSRAAADGGQRWFHLYPDETMNHEHPLHWTGREQTWNYQCAACHSTGLQKNYDLGTDSYRTSWAEIDVSCEACHGPGAAHVEKARVAEGTEVAKASGLVVDLKDRSRNTWIVDDQTGKPRRTLPRSTTEMDTCGPCHSRRTQIRESDHYGQPLHDTHRLALLDEGLYFADGQIRGEVYVHGSFIQSHMYQAGVSCSDCHDPHSLKLRAEGNGVCAGCHVPSRYDTAAHHHHSSGSRGAACIGCHMPQRLYMVVDERADHSMRIPRPDLSVRIGTPNACNQCHADRSAQWAAQEIQKWSGQSAPPPHFGEVLHAGRSQDTKAADRLLALATDKAQPAIARATALELLAGQARPGDLATVRRWLSDSDALVRRAAVEYMENAGPSVRGELLFPVLDDPLRTVRMEAARLLAPLMRHDLATPKRHRLNTVLEEYARAQVVNAQRPESHLNLGNLARDVGNFRAAEEAYRTALRLQPDFAPAFVNLADLFREQGQDDDGERLLREGLRTVPETAALHHALGLLLVRQKRMDRALEHLERAAVLAPNNRRYAEVYAVALRELGRDGFHAWSCGALEVETKQSGETLTLRTADGMTFELDLAPAASGTKYTNGTVTFWSKGAEAKLSMERKSLDCTLSK